MQIDAVIIDDEPNNINNLSVLLDRYCPAVQIVGSALSARDARELLKRTSPLLVFLDIQMPGEDGFSLLRSLREYFFEVIFVTAFDHYAIQAVRFAAIDYLLKPIVIADLKNAVANATRAIGQQRENAQIRNLLNILQEANRLEHRLALPGLRETRFVTIDQVVRCESANNYTHIFLLNGEKVTVSRPIFEYTDMLSNYGFIRCHQSHLINRRMVKSWIHDGGDGLLMRDGATVPVSRAKKEQVRNSLAEI